jgi:hypothetical protein
MGECKLWQKRFADASECEPVRSDIPALILTGRYDDRFPAEHAKRIASIDASICLPFNCPKCPFGYEDQIARSILNFSWGRTKLLFATPL